VRSPDLHTVQTGVVKLEANSTI